MPSLAKKGGLETLGPGPGVKGLEDLGQCLTLVSCLLAPLVLTPLSCLPVLLLHEHL